MADITMCPDHECPSRESCYRYTARPSERQSWYDFSKDRAGQDRCNAYWDRSA